MHHRPGDTHRPVPSPLNSRLSGTGRVADDLYLIAHHETTGRPYLPPRVLGRGIAGGLLAELMDGDRPPVTLQRGYVVLTRDDGGNPVARYARPGEPVARGVLDAIMSEPRPLPARDWLVFLAETSTAEVAERLELSGYLTRSAERMPWRSRRLVPGDQDWAQCAVVRAEAGLSATGAPARYQALLAGLAIACGLGFRLSGRTNAPVGSIEGALPVLSPALRQLIAHVQVTADSALLSNRK